MTFMVVNTADKHYQVTLYGRKLQKFDAARLLRNGGHPGHCVVQGQVAVPGQVVQLPGQLQFHGK